jgi:hypothetical protein
MRESTRAWLTAHRIRVTCATTGALAVSLTFFCAGASVPWYTDIEATFAYAALAIFVHALIGGIGGWALGALIDSIIGPRP